MGGAGAGGSVVQTGGAPAGGGAGVATGGSTAGATASGGGANGMGGASDASPSRDTNPEAYAEAGVDASLTDVTPSDSTATDAAPVDRAAALAIMRRVAAFELAKFGTTFNNNWVRAVFYAGLMALYRTSQDASYLAAAQSWGQRNNWALGPDHNSRPLPTPDDSRFADNQACVQTYAELYLQNSAAATPAMLATATAAFDKMIATPVAGRTEWWWCDALFMAPAALARTATALNRPQYIDLMNTLFWDTKAYLFSPTQHLFFRDDSFFASNTFWSRGNGWAVGGIARILDFLPAADAHRADYENLLREMSDKLRTLQASDGFWRSNLLVPTAFPNPESSGTAFFCYGMAWGINRGVLDRATYLEPVLRAWRALVGVINAQGQIGYVQPVGAQPGPAAVTDTNDYAAGAFLLAGSEIMKL
jgi:rhamnogalacturonyl hydrolase YesR